MESFEKSPENNKMSNEDIAKNVEIINKAIEKSLDKKDSDITNVLNFHNWIYENGYKTSWEQKAYGLHKAEQEYQKTQPEDTF